MSIRPPEPRLPRLAEVVCVAVALVGLGIAVYKSLNTLRFGLEYVRNHGEPLVGLALITGALIVFGIHSHTSHR